MQCFYCVVCESGTILCKWYMKKVTFSVKNGIGRTLPA